MRGESVLSKPPFYFVKTSCLLSGRRMSSCHLGFTRFPLWAAALNFCVFGITFLSPDEWSVKSNLRITGPQINNFKGCNYANARFFFSDLCPLRLYGRRFASLTDSFLFPCISDSRKAGIKPLSCSRVWQTAWLGLFFFYFHFFSFLPLQSPPFVRVAVRAASSLFAAFSQSLEFPSKLWTKEVFFFFFFALLISWSKGLTTCTFSHTPMHILVWSIPPPKLSGSFCWNSWQMYSMPLTPAWIFTLPLLLASCAPEHFWHLAWMLCIHHLRAFLVPFG